MTLSRCPVASAHGAGGYDGCLASCQAAEVTSSGGRSKDRGRLVLTGLSAFWGAWGIVDLCGPSLPVMDAF